MNVSVTLAALPVALISINPRLLVGCAIPNLAKTFAPAPSPNPMTYFTCKKSRTVTRSSPSVFKDGNWKLNSTVLKKMYARTIFFQTYESGRLSALSACPDTSMWMKHERSLISVIHGLFTNSWNELWLQPKSWTVMNTALFSCWVRSPWEFENFYCLMFYTKNFSSTFTWTVTLISPLLSVFTTYFCKIKEKNML